ncbi:MAG: hypothetical protein CH6_1037 [Candidatus Kapaibacterium sp.]|nr:MAG: hypothetical protein CH6_1037 [Candidatus Kapabacteria bacterium]
MKLSLISSVLGAVFGLEPTYKELKHFYHLSNISIVPRLEPTYKELKPH